MISKNGSYFAPELISGGHYIVTGRTNDSFVDDNLQVIDVRQALQQQLKKSDFDAVIFFDYGNRIYCYDHESFNILNNPFSDAPRSENSGVRRRRPLSRAGRARIRQLQGQTEHQQQGPEAGTPTQASWEDTLSYARIDIDEAWVNIISILKQTRYRCAFVFSNITSLVYDFSQRALQAFSEISAINSNRPHAAFYIFRTEGCGDFTEYAEQGNDCWRSFYKLIIEPLFNTNDPMQNRVINLGTPNSKEVTNLLNCLRLSEDRPLKVKPADIRELSEEIAAICASNNLGLKSVMISLDKFIASNPSCFLNLDNVYEALGVKSQPSAMDQLDLLVGLDDFKKWVREWYQSRVNNGAVKLMPLGSSRFLPLPQPVGNAGLSMNLCLMGNPGTGKTEIATLMGRLYYELGLLPQGHLVHRSAAEMISSHVGETASRVRQTVQEAIGGVLFIDEAYALTANNSAHGREAVDQLVNDMTAYQGQFAVIIAGYEKPMKRFLAANQGLASRFGEVKLLPDYTPPEMVKIFHSFVNKSSLKVSLSSEFEAAFPAFCESWATDHDRKWGNAREAGKLLEAMIRRASSRMYENHEKGDIVLTTVDIPPELRDHLKGKATDLNGIIKELDETIGLDNVRKKLKNIAQRVGWSDEPPAPGRYIFHGPPGTGKTHMARIMGNLLFRMGVLSRNYVYELTAKQLQHPDPEIDYGKSGHAEPTLSEIIEEAVNYARGGVLFIDEAHQLADDDLGEATLRALVPIIERPEVRADTCIILAGYTDRITAMLAEDDGLARRFPETNRIRFDSYTAEELTALAKLFAKQLGHSVYANDQQDKEVVGKRKVDPKLDFCVRTRIAMEKFLENPKRNYGEAGYIRDTYVVECIERKNKRLSQKRLNDEDAIPDKEQAKLEHKDNKFMLTAEDIPEPFFTYAGPLTLDPPPVKTVWDRVDDLMGKDELKTYLVNRKNLNGKIARFYDQTSDMGAHFALSGPTGSGRHHSASVIAAVFKEIGIIDRSQIEWVSKGDFEAQFVGQTIPKTMGIIERAKGGCLVVQNPSSMLTRSATDNSFGPEALATIAGAMGSSTDKLSVIFIDSIEGMEQVLKSIPELRGKFTRRFTFDEFTPVEMKNLFDAKCHNSIVFSDEINELMLDFFINWVSKKGNLGENSDGWCNGKEVDRLIDELKTAWDKYPLPDSEKTKSVNGVECRYITRDMFPEEYAQYITDAHDDLQSAFKKLNDLPGLDGVKAAVKNIERRVRLLESKKSGPGCYAFVGNPGTGKTKVARIIGDILRGTGALSQGQVIERTASEVVRDFAENSDSVAKLVKMARNGILFIDEAPQLAESNVGRAVMKKLLTIIEDPKVINDTCFILAGYESEMAQLLATDPGFESRFGKPDSIIRFEDYTPEQLMKVMNIFAADAAKDPYIAAKYPLDVSDSEFQKVTLQVFEYMYEHGGKNYGNARFVRNYLSGCISGMLERIDQLPEEERQKPNNLRVLRKEDIPEKYAAIFDREILPATVDGMALNTAVEVDGISPISDELKNKWGASVVFIEVTTTDGAKGCGSGIIITQNGIVLTACHVVENAQKVSVKLYTPGIPGSEHRWFDAVVMEPVFKELDIALIKVKGSNFVPLPLRPADEPVKVNEEISLIGYPGGNNKSGGDSSSLTPSCKDGRIDSLQDYMGYEHAYLGNLGMPGDSGGAVISHRDGRVIGVLQGGVKSGKDGKYEQTYFIPIKYVWEKFVKGSELTRVSQAALEEMMARIQKELAARKSGLDEVENPKNNDEQE